MQRQRGELVPIGEVVTGLDDELVPAIRNDSPQARRGFTLADQVHQLVRASEADPDLGFMARTMALMGASGTIWLISMAKLMSKSWLTPSLILLMPSRICGLALFNNSSF